MNRRALLLLLGVLAALGILAGIATLGDPWGASPGEGQPGLLLPGLKDQLNVINRIVISGPGNQTIATLERGAERWTVTERNNYPADVGRIRKNLLVLADARIVEEKTSSPGFYDRLGVQDVSDPAAKGMQLALTGGKQPVTVIIGLNQAGSGDLTYVRRAGEAKSWLVKGKFDIGKAAGDWLDKSLTDIPMAQIQSVSIDHPGTETLRIAKAKPDDADFSVVGLPAGRTLAYPGVTNSIGGVLANLQLEDAQTRDILGPDPGKPVVARFVTTDGLTVETSAWQIANGTRITFTASGTGSAEKEAAALNARLGSWVYTLPSYKTEQLTRRLQDLVTPASK